VHYSKQRAYNSEVMKEEHCKMMVIHPHFAVEKVEKHIALMFEPFNQHLGMQLQHPALFNDLLLNTVPPYTITNILVYRPIRI
jgi:hypothetical protein